MSGSSLVASISASNVARGRGKRPDSFDSALVSYV